MTCINDADGDVGCGRRMCPSCGPAARAAAVEAEAAANQASSGQELPPAGGGPAGTGAAETAVVESTGSTGGDRPVVKVSISAFSRSVDVEAPEHLDRVSEVALQLWRQTSDMRIQPVGPSGFSMSEPSAFPPLPVRGLIDPGDRVVRYAA